MSKRSIGVTALASSTAMYAIYSQYAAVSLLLTGAAFAAGGSIEATLSLLTGFVFLGLTVLGYAVAVGLWFRRAWSWNGAVALFLVFFVANISLSVLATNFLSALLPSIGVVFALIYLQRPAVRAEITGTPEPAATSRVAEGLGAAGHAH